MFDETRGHPYGIVTVDIPVPNLYVTGTYLEIDNEQHDRSNADAGGSSIDDVDAGQLGHSPDSGPAETAPVEIAEHIRIDSDVGGRVA